MTALMQMGGQILESVKVNYRLIGANDKERGGNIPNHDRNEKTLKVLETFRVS